MYFIPCNKELEMNKREHLVFRGTAAGVCFHAYCRKLLNATMLLPPWFIEIFISKIGASKQSVIVTNI